MPVFSRDGVHALFIHVPKTGGTYVEDLFRANGFQLSFWKPNRIKPVEAISPQHYHAALLAQIFNLSDFKLTFMTVRSPLERLRSEYRMRDPGGSQSFEDWTVEALDHLDKDRSSADNHLRPQTEFYLPGTHIFKLEDGLNTRFANILEAHLGTPLAVKQVARRRDNRKWHAEESARLTLSAATLSRVHETYGDDFDRFGYPPGIK